MNGTGSLVLYDHGESVCCHKVRIVLAEKGLSYERRNVALERGEQTASEFLAINPKGVVPVIFHNGRTITESSIITEYLDDAFPEPGLMPSDPYWRARRRYWANWIDAEMHVPHIATISFIISFSAAFRQEFDTQQKLEAYLAAVPDKKQRQAQAIGFSSGIDSPAFRDALFAWEKFLAAMDQQLEESDWLAGPTYSLADIDVVPYIWRLHNLQMDNLWAHLRRIRDWLNRITSRPAFQLAVLEQSLPEWIALMEASGREAWPQIAPLLTER